MREVFRLLDWMLHLREDLGRNFVQELRALEEELHMPYVTSVERYAREDGLTEGLAKGFAEGRTEGRTEGQRDVVLRQLAKVCGELPEPVKDRVSTLSAPQLEHLADGLLQFKNMADLTKWLDRR